MNAAALEDSRGYKTRGFGIFTTPSGVVLPYLPTIYCLLSISRARRRIFWGGFGLWEIYKIFVNFGG
jgi:hypothetical protein